MSIILTALALTAGAQAAPPSQAQPSKPVDHAQHQQGSPKHEAADCPCCDHAADGKKMACCEKHEKGQSAKHDGHSAH